MFIRPSAIAFAATCAGLVATPVLADPLHTGGIPVFNSNMMMSPHALPAMGGAGLPLVVPNLGPNTNIAAGIGNGAGQHVLGAPGANPMVGLNFGGRAPLVSTNVDVNTNVAAGIGNVGLQNAQH